jgi:hypothetical protein
MNMLIESVSPELVGAKSTLPACLRAEAAIRGWPDAERETHQVRAGHQPQDC